MGVLKVLFLGIMTVFLAWGAPAGAEEDGGRHALDAWLEEALAADSSTAGMAAVYAEGTKRWDGELNVQYKLLTQKLRPKALQALRASQRLWIAYRDGEIAAARAVGDELYDINGGGTIWGLIVAERVMNITRARTLELQTYVRYLSGSLEEP